ncbi:MAG: YbdD/YjiX family protein [Phycisphaerales bacterium]|nr:YbdD/YjiX family protein [Phycisphaerales bacterium]
MQPHTDCSVHTSTCDHSSVTGANSLSQYFLTLCQAWRRIIGAPDYGLYLARHQRIHPEVPPMSEKEFFRFAIDRRYSKAGPRCC